MEVAIARFDKLLQPNIRGWQHCCHSDTKRYGQVSGHLQFWRLFQEHLGYLLTFGSGLLREKDGEYQGSIAAN